MASEIFKKIRKDWNRMAQTNSYSALKVLPIWGESLNSIKEDKEGPLEVTKGGSLKVNPQKICKEGTTLKM
jgi:hypothetical protein